MAQRKRVSFMSGGRRITFMANPNARLVQVPRPVIRLRGQIQLTRKQIRKFRMVRKQLDKREKQLSRKHGVNVQILDLNSHFTRGNRIPKDAITKEGKPVLTMGLANTRTKTISVDQRVPRSGQNRVILHEKEHLMSPRATEEEIEQTTQRKFGFKELPKRLRRKQFTRLRS